MFDLMNKLLMRRASTASGGCVNVRTGTVLQQSRSTRAIQSKPDTTVRYDHCTVRLMAYSNTSLFLLLGSRQPAPWRRRLPLITVLRLLQVWDFLPPPQGKQHQK